MKKIYDCEIKHQPNTEICFLDCDNLIKGATKSIMNQTLWITIIIYNIMSVGWKMVSSICLGGISDKNKDFIPYPVPNIISYYTIQYTKNANDLSTIYLDTSYYDIYGLEQYNGTSNLYYKEL